MINQLNAEIKSAMRAKDKARLTTLRGIKSDADSIAKKDVRETTSEDVENAILRGVKQRQEAVDLYIKGGREDLAENEKAEIVILQEFLPEQLTEEEISELVDDAIATLGATTKKEMGKVIGYVNGKIAKGSAEGKVIAKIVGSKLN